MNARPSRLIQILGDIPGHLSVLCCFLFFAAVVLVVATLAFGVAFAATSSLGSPDWLSYAVAAASALVAGSFAYLFIFDDSDEPPPQPVVLPEKRRVEPARYASSGELLSERSDSDAWLGSGLNDEQSS